MVSNRFDIRDSRCRRYYVLAATRKAPEERTCCPGFRWIEGLVWIGDAEGLLLQDLPRNRTMRWIESAGAIMLRRRFGRMPTEQTLRDRQAQLISSLALDAVDLLAFEQNSGRCSVPHLFAGRSPWQGSSIRVTQ